MIDENGSLTPIPLEIIEIEFIEDDLGYDLNNSLIIVYNETTFFVTDEALNITSSKIWVTYEFQNNDMHHWWLPDGYDVCIMGTTNTGQDLFSKILYGSRISLKIGITVAFLTVALGTIVGSISGYYGGVIDEVIMRITDVFFAVPGLILAMAFVAALQNTTSLTIAMSTAAFLLLFFNILSTRNVISELITGEGTDRNLMFKIKNKLASQSDLENKVFNFKNSILEIALFLLRFRGVLLVGLTLIFLGSFWPELWSNNTDVKLVKSLTLVAIFTLYVVITILDKTLNEGVPSKLISKRISESFDFGNPYRFLALRTILIFISVVLLIFVTKSSDSDFILIKDFDRLWKIQAALILTGWPGYARLIRGQVLYIREMTFVEAAKSVGAPDGRIMFRHILPSAWAPLLVAFTLDVGGTILSASGLSFIGLGAEPGTAEWGILVSDGRRFFPNSWWLVTFPGLAILLTTLGFNLLGDGLRDIVDPKNKR